MKASADTAAPSVSAGAATGGSAEESVRSGGALCAESVGGGHGLSGGRRVGHTQQRATQRANRDIALARRNWTDFGSDSGGRTATVLRSFIASSERSGIESFAWFRDVLSRIPGALHHPAH
jgi:hypothetical protein